MKEAHLWIEPEELEEGRIVASAIIECPGFGRQRLWFSIPADYRAALSTNADPFVLGAVFMAMKSGFPLQVHGSVSPSLLLNLAEFQAVWQCWYPHRYRKVAIEADIEREHPPAATSQCLSAFSGGVDSCFSVWQHSKLGDESPGRKISAAIMIHGFDIPLEEKEPFGQAFANSRKILRCTDIELIPVATNFKNLKQFWGDAHGAGLAFCLMMLQNRFAEGLIASSVSYEDLYLPYGSTPVSDGLMSSANFVVIHDGSGYTRNQKIAEIAVWPDAMRYLRVCWEGAQRDRNCCVCPKCVRTILNFRVMGAGLPACFERDISDDQIAEMRGLCSDELYDLTKIYQQGKESFPHQPWLKALHRAILVNRAHNYRRRLWLRAKGGVRRRWRAALEQWPYAANRGRQGGAL